MCVPSPGPPDRGRFVEHCVITIKVEVFNKMPRRWSADPDRTALMIYDAITSNIKLPILREKFREIVAPEMSAIFCDWERGKPRMRRR